MVTGDAALVSASVLHGGSDEAVVVGPAAVVDAGAAVLAPGADVTDREEPEEREPPPLHAAATMNSDRAMTGIARFG
jgi:hypothetical protein